MSSRQSTLRDPNGPAQPSTNQSRAATLSQAPAPTAFGATRLLEKQHEWQGVAALKEASLSMLEHVDQLSQQSDIMADGGKAIGSVLANWPNVFRIISLCAAQSKRSRPGEVSDAVDDVPTEPEPLQRLVRLQIEGLQTTEGRSNSS